MVATLDPLKAQPHTLGRPSAIQCPIYLFKEHYNSLCDGKDYVNRSDFNPFHIPHILPHIAILETADKVNDTGLFDFKIRLSGEEVVNCHRANHTGKKLSDIYDGEELLDRLELYNSILHQPRIKVLQNITPHRLPYHVKIDKGIFPFSSSGNQIDQLFFVEKRNGK